MDDEKSAVEPTRAGDGRSAAARLRHDLRNDLTVVLGYAELLAAMDGVPEAARTRALAIAEHAGRMVERLRLAKEAEEAAAVAPHE